MAVAFANIFMGKVETEILSQSTTKPLIWKRYIDDIFSLWETNREVLTEFIDKANNHHPTIKFTAEIFDTETTFLDTSVYKGERFISKAVLDIRTHNKATGTFQYTRAPEYTHFSLCRPPGVRKGFIKAGEALRLLRTNSSKTMFGDKIKHFCPHLIERGYPEGLVHRTLSEVIFENRKQAILPKPKTNKKNLAFCNAIPPSSTKRKTDSHEALAFNRKTKIAQRNIQRTTSNIVQKR